MKSTLYALIVLFFLLVSCQKKYKSRAGLITDKATTIAFTHETIDFGKVKEGTIVSHTYKFKNTGKYPLLMGDIYVSCGCTHPEVTESAIAPGETDSITIKFNTTGKYGLQKKAITVYANTEPEQTELTFTALVIPKMPKSPKDSTALSK